MILKDLEKTEKMPGYDLVCAYEAGVPFYEMRLKVLAQKKLAIPAIALFVLRLIDMGVNTDTEISRALGMESEFTRNALEWLNLNLLIKHRFDRPTGLAFAPTDKGRLALKNALAASFVTYLDIEVDGLLGQVAPLHSSFRDGSDLRKEDILTLHATPGARPTVESLSDNLGKLKAIYRERAEDMESDSELIEVLDVDKSRLTYQVVNVLAFRNGQNGQMNLRVFEGYESVPEYDAKLTQRERDGSRVIPDSTLVGPTECPAPSDLTRKLQPNLEKLEEQSQRQETLESEREALKKSEDEAGATPEVVTSRTRRIQELEAELSQIQEEQQRNRYIKSDREHYTILKHALSTVGKRLIIVSPWIKRGAVDEEIIKLIQSALHRGVWIAIGYGMPPYPGQTRDDYIDGWVKGQFERLGKQPNGNRLHIEWLHNTHEKVLVCDDNFCVVTSYNWLSYRGDRGFRRERGMYHEDPRMVQEVTGDVLKAFKSLPSGFPTEVTLV